MPIEHITMPTPVELLLCITIRDRGWLLVRKVRRWPLFAFTGVDCAEKYRYRISAVHPLVCQSDFV